MDLICGAKDAFIGLGEFVYPALGEVAALLVESLLGLRDHLFGDGEVLHRPHGRVEHLALAHQSALHVLNEIALSRPEVFLRLLHLLPGREDFIHDLDAEAIRVFKAQVLEELADAILGNEGELQLDLVGAVDVEDQVFLALHLHTWPFPAHYCLHPQHLMLGFQDASAYLRSLQLVHLIPREYNFLSGLANAEEFELFGLDFIMVLVIEGLADGGLKLLEGDALADGDAEGLLVVEQQEVLVDVAVVEVRLLKDVERHGRIVLDMLEDCLCAHCHSRCRLPAQQQPHLLQRVLHLYGEAALQRQP
jgi:hypothetical protein